MNTSSWTVRARLTVGFGIVCAMLLVIMGIGLFSMSRIQAGLVDVVDDRIPKMDAANTVASRVDAIAISLRNMMLTQDQADRNKQIEIIKESRQVVVKNIELLEKLVTTPKGIELLKEIKAQRARYLAGQEALIALVMADKQDESIAYLNKELHLGADCAADGNHGVFGFRGT